MSVNQLNLQHSLRTHLAAVMGVQVVWLYDGVTLPTTKPFMSVEQMQNNNEIIAKMRDAVSSVHRFQVGLYASSASERATLQARVKRTLLFDQIPLIDAGQPTKPIVGYFYAEITNEVPMPAESVSDKTQHHKLYFDVEVPTIYYR